VIERQRGKSFCGVNSYSWQQASTTAPSRAISSRSIASRSFHNLFIHLINLVSSSFCWASEHLYIIYMDDSNIGCPLLSAHDNADVFVSVRMYRNGKNTGNSTPLGFEPKAKY
jgi:hypothetical protein